MPRVFRHWRLIASIWNCKSSMKIATDEVSRLTKDFFNLFKWTSVLKRTPHDSTCDGHHTIFDQVEVCSGPSPWRHNNFSNSRRAYHPSTKSFDVIKQRWGNTGAEKGEFFTSRRDHLGYMIKPGCLAVTLHRISTNDGLQKPSIITEWRSNFV